MPTKTPSQRRNYAALYGKMEEINFECLMSYIEWQVKGGKLKDDFPDEVFGADKLDGHQKKNLSILADLFTQEYGIDIKGQMDSYILRMDFISLGYKGQIDFKFLCTDPMIDRC